MNLGKILAKVGMSVIKSVVPGAGIVIDAVNAFLPGDKKLPANATGQQATEAINSLPPDIQAQVLDKQLDVEIVEVQEYTKVITALADADKTGHSTRPKIADKMANVTIYAVTVAITVWGGVMISVSISADDPVDALKHLVSSWPFIVGVLTGPLALLRAYFAMRSKEKKARYEIAKNPVPESSGGIVGMVKGLFK